LGSWAKMGTKKLQWIIKQLLMSETPYTPRKPMVFIPELEGEWFMMVHDGSNEFYHTVHDFQSRYTIFRPGRPGGSSHHGSGSHPKMEMRLFSTSDLCHFNPFHISSIFGWILQQKTQQLDSQHTQKKDQRYCDTHFPHLFPCFGFFSRNGGTSDIISL